MLEQTPDSASSLSEVLAWRVLARLAEGGRVRRRLPGGGTIHFDRRLPFLCVSRAASQADAEVVAPLVTAESAYLLLPQDGPSLDAARKFARVIIDALAQHFGSFLVIEVWLAGDPAAIRPVHEESGEPLPPAPAFTICAPSRGAPTDTIARLAEALGRIRVFRQKAEVQVRADWSGRPLGQKPLLSPAEARRHGCYVLGIEVRPVFRDPETGQVFPAVLRRMRRELTAAIKKGLFAFVCTCTNMRPKHYWTLGRRTVVKGVWQVDRQLAEVGASFDLLLQATPINAEAAWYEFRRSRFEKPPRFRYRPLAVEPTLLKRKLFSIPLEKVEDPTLAHLFAQKQDELDRQITMLTDVGTRRFLLGSLQLYRPVSEELMAVARSLLERIPPRARDDLGGHVDAQAFARLAQQELEWYRQQYPKLSATVSVRDDMYPGLLTSQGNLLIGKKTQIPARRVNALLQHEIGTHVLTYFNGKAQPFRQLYVGLAGYEELQEGLAVLSEYLVGGLTRPRLRLLGARVMAASQLVDGATFVDTFRLLTREYHFPQRLAYTITMRVYRAGGLTKDIVYLRGLLRILDYVREGGQIEPLLVGKIAADHIPLIAELQLRHILRPAPLRPRYLNEPGVEARLVRLRQGLTVQDMVEADAAGRRRPTKKGRGADGR